MYVLKNNTLIIIKVDMLCQYVNTLVIIKVIIKVQNFILQNTKSRKSAKTYFLDAS